MAAEGSVGLKRPRRPVRRWWQRAIRWVVLVTLLLCAACVTLPWWAPTDLLRRRLAASLSHQAGTEVGIDSLTLSWSEGVVIEGLRVGEGGPFPDSLPLLRVGRVSAALHPAWLFAGGDLEWVQIERPTLAIRLDAEGGTNLGPLQRLADGPLRIARVGIHDARVQITGPQGDPVRLGVSDLQLERGRLTQLGRLTLSGRFEQHSAPAGVSLIARTQTDQGEAAARANLTLHRIDLEQLPLIEWFDLPLRRLEGRLSGTIELTANPQAVVDRVRCVLHVEGLDVQSRQGDQAASLDEAGIEFNARWDPLGGRLDVEAIHLRIPGANLSGRAAATTTRSGRGWWEMVDSLNLQGELHAEQLLALVASDVRLREALRFTEPVEAEIALLHQGRAMRLQLAVDATAAEISREGRVIKPHGRACRVEFEGVVDDRVWAMESRRLAGVLGNNSFHGSLSVPDLRAVGRVGPRAAGQERHPEGSGRLAAIASALGPVRVTGELADLPAVAELHQALEDLLERISLDGSAEWRLSMLPPVRGDGVRLLAGVTIPRESALRIPGWLDKPAGEGALDVSARWVMPEGGPAIETLHGELSLGRSLVRVTVQDVLLPQPAQPETFRVQGRWEVRGVEGLLPVWTLSADLAGRLHGDARGYFHVHRALGGEGLTVSADLGSLAIDLPDRIAKPAMLPATARFVVQRALWAGEGGRWQVALDAQTPVAGGEVRLSLPADAPAVAPWELAALTAEGAVQIRDARRMLEILPILDAPLGAWNLAGQADLAWRYRRTATQHDLELTVGADGLEGEFPLGETVAGADRLVKPAGLGLTAELTASYVPQSGRLDVSHLRASVGGTHAHLRATGRLDRDVAGGLDGVSPQALTLTFEAGDLAEWQALVPGWSGLALGGRSSGQVSYSPRNGWRAELHMGGVEAHLRERDVRLDGELLVEGLHPPAGDGARWRAGRIVTDTLQFAIGENRGWLIMDLAGVPQRPVGEVHLLMDLLDDRDLATWVRGRADERVPMVRLGEQELAELGERADALLREWVPVLGGASVEARLTARRLRSYDLSVGETYQVENVVASIELDRGRVTMDYRGLLNGGLIQNRYRVHLGSPRPEVTIQTVLRDVIAEPEIRPQMAKYFPGNDVRGYFNRTEDSRAPLRYVVMNTLDPRYTLRPLGTARTEAIDGSVRGQALPDWAARLLPNLDMSEYRYERMVGFAEMLGDGSARNDMIFRGRRYDVYMEGTSDALDRVEYEIGLLLAGRDPEWNHVWKQGRVPLLRFRGRIEAGTMQDEEVSLIWLNEGLFTIFLRNNVFYRAWLQQQAQRDGR